VVIQDVEVELLGGGTLDGIGHTVGRGDFIILQDVSY
jgi:hypothetical protein